MCEIKKKYGWSIREREKNVYTDNFMIIYDERILFCSTENPNQADWLPDSDSAWILSMM